jgi:hypothetical protein
LSEHPTSPEPFTDAQIAAAKALLDTIRPPETFRNPLAVDLVHALRAIDLADYARAVTQGREAERRHLRRILGSLRRRQFA